MKNKLGFILAVCTLIFIAMACNASFTTANISSLNFGKNETANPPTTTFDVGDKVNAVAVVSNAMGKNKVKFKVFFENVQGKNKGEEGGSKDFDFEGGANINFFFTAPLPGEYKVEATLFDDKGKQIDQKSGVVTVKGSAPASTETKKDSADTKKDEDSDQDK